MRRAAHAAGYSWRKWQPAYVVRPWHRTPEGMAGFWLICASLGALAAVLVR